MGHVYSILLSCGSIYVGQTGQCLNTRLREYSSSLKAALSGNFSIRVKDCTCSPMFGDTTFLLKQNGKLGRELADAYFIRRRVSAPCISTPSLCLHNENFDLKKK